MITKCGQCIGTYVFEKNGSLFYIDDDADVFEVTNEGLIEKIKVALSVATNDESQRYIEYLASIGIV